jgi:hypothetical protein
MEQLKVKSKIRRVWLSMAASLAVGLCLFAGHGIRISTPPTDPLSARSEHYFANPSPGEPAVTSPEKQTRVQSKTSRRLVHFGALPPTNSADAPAISDERARAESLWHHSTARSLPRDRAPPVLA